MNKMKLNKFMIFALSALIIVACGKTATPALTIGSTMISEKDDATLVYVPAGEFTMGSDADNALAECQKYRTNCSRDWFTNEEPPHSVTLDAFWIDQTEVTNAMYAKCVSAGVCKEPTDKSSNTHSSYYGDPLFNSYPVLYVNWEMAKTYCEWRDEKTTLPNEAQWEKTARGTDGNIYPWGNTFDGTKVNSCDVNCSQSWANKSFDDKYADVSPVGSYPVGQSVYGALDMAGNVWEWVNDWYGETYYQSSPLSNPLGADSGQYRVLRGGSWYFNDDSVRSAYRGRYVPTDTYNNAGFRCARSLLP